MAGYFSNNRKGIILILVYALVALIFIVLGVFFYTSMQSMKTGQRQNDFLKAFYAAESAVDSAILNLPAHSFPMPNIAVTNIGASAQYSAVITPFDATQVPFTKWIIRGTGFVPNSATAPRVEVEVEAIVEEQVRESGFFGNAIYSASNLTIRGNSFSIDGDVFYDENSTFNVQHPENITGDVNSGEPIDFTTDIDYNLLRTIAANQQATDVYDHVINVSNWGSSTLPPNFWYDQANGIPNVIYVEGTGTLTISGNRNMAGFIVVTSGDCSVTGT